jgi:hypothetical protein
LRQRLLADAATVLAALLLDLQMQKACKQIEPAIALPHLCPQIRGTTAVAGRIGRVARAASQPAVERQKLGCIAGQSRGHRHGFSIDSKMHQRPALEFEQRFAVIAVALVLRNGVNRGLPGQRILQLGGGHRDAVERQHQIQLIAIA